MNADSKQLADILRSARSRVCMGLPCCQIVFLLILMYLCRNNLFHLKLFHTGNISRFTRMQFWLICESLLWYWIEAYLVDEHPPLRTKEMPRRPRFVYYRMFTVSKIQVKNALASGISEYYIKKVKTFNGNQRTLFSVAN